MKLPSTPQTQAPQAPNGRPGWPSALSSRSQTGVSTSLQRKPGVVVPPVYRPANAAVKAPAVYRPNVATPLQPKEGVAPPQQAKANINQHPPRLQRMAGGQTIEPRMPQPNVAPRLPILPGHVHPQANFVSHHVPVQRKVTDSIQAIAENRTPAPYSTETTGKGRGVVQRYNSIVLVGDQTGLMVNTSNISKRLGVNPVWLAYADFTHMTLNDTLVIQGHGDQHSMTMSGKALAAELHRRNLRACKTIEVYGCETGKGFYDELVLSLRFDHQVNIAENRGLAPEGRLIIDTQGKPWSMKSDALYEQKKHEILALYGGVEGLQHMQKANALGNDLSNYTPVGSSTGWNTSVPLIDLRSPPMNPQSPPTTPPQAQNPFADLVSYGKDIGFL